MAIKITADTTCDLPPALLERHQITLAPLTIVMGGRSYKDGVDIFPDDIFRFVDGGGALPTTAAVSVGEYQAFFARFAGQYDAVVHTTISADMSSSYQNACIAAEDFPNVYVVDSRNISCGHGHLTVQAALAAERGMSAPDIVALLHDLIPRVETALIIDRLDYMVKGGRCSAVAMLGANLLNLKPAIELVDDNLRVAKKYRGSYRKCLLAFARERLAGRDDVETGLLLLPNPAAPDDCISALLEDLPSYAPFREIYAPKTHCTIACHCGPHTVGIMLVRKG